MSSRRWNITSARRDSEVSRQDSKASLATPTARSTSSTEAKSTAACCSPVAGFQTGPERPDSLGTSFPPM